MPEQPDIISHYRILRKLGSGGMGDVYLAQDTRLDRTVALKTLKPDIASEVERMRRFIQEAKMASSLNHPNILTIFEIGEVDSSRFIATEYIDGETLRQRISRSSLDLNELLEVAVQVASALVATHKAKIIHRDIKPENIMLRHDDRFVKVLDFGLAKLAEKPADTLPATEAPTLVNTAPGVVLGTVAYMSPEQARGVEVDERTDLWSLGVVLFEMVAGCLPFLGSSTNEVIAAILSKEPAAPVARYAHNVPEKLEDIVAKALAKDREERYQSATDLLLDLKRLKQRLEMAAEFERTAGLQTLSRQLSRQESILRILCRSHARRLSSSTSPQSSAFRLRNFRPSLPQRYRVSPSHPIANHFSS